MEDSEESKSILQIKKSIITKLDIDNKKLKILTVYSTIILRNIILNIYIFVTTINHY